jgi:hypothetical protein
MRILASFVIGALVTTSAAAADLVIVAPQPVVHSHMPDCSDPAVLRDIARKFAAQDAHIIHSGLAIVGVEGMHQTRFKGRPSLTDVRFCIGVALLSNGRTSEVVYIIEAPMKGPFSLGWAVESCLPPFDPYRVYDGNCRSIRG